MGTRKNLVQIAVRIISSPTPTNMDPLLLNPPSYTLSPMDRALVTLRIEVHEREESRLSQDAAVLGAQLAAIESKLKAETTAINGLQSLLAPINSLSSDVLYEIISRAIAESPEHDITSKTNPARVLSQVSRRWRSIALTSPMLWTDIAFRDIKPNPSNHPLVRFLPDGTRIRYARTHWLRDTRFATQRRPTLAPSLGELPNQHHVHFPSPLR